MTGIANFPEFLIASILLILSPGPGTLAILGAATGNHRAGFAALVGTSTGDALLMLAASVGVAALLAAWPPAFLAIKYLGGGYLVWLGIKSLLAKVESGFALSEPEHGKAFKRSLLVTLLNPKAIVFFMAFFPQFVTPSAPPSAFVILGTVFIALNCTYQAVLIFGAVRIARHLDEVPVFALWVNRLLGAVFILFGLKLAVG